MLKVLVAISQKFCYRKETWGYAKVIQKKRERKKRKKEMRKNRQVPEIFKIMGT